MKISEAVKVLNEALIEVGDVELVIATLVDGQFYIEADRDLEIIQLPDENGKLESVVAALNFDTDDVEDIKE